MNLRETKKMSIGAAIVLLVLLIVILQRFVFASDHPPVSFYYWKQTYAIDNRQQEILSDCQSENIYVKFFDVIPDENNQQPKPVSIIEFREHPKLNIVPCIYIQNDVFKHDPSPEELSGHILGLIRRIAGKNRLKIREIQIDCDWTETTRQPYFTFLRVLQQNAPKQEITSTIRLHQIKYQSETGVPPVKKGVLMCYNMDDLEEFNTGNSIISPETLKKYISPTTSYPIELDLALPVYQWGLVFRLGKLALIVNDISEKELRNPNFTEVKPHYFQALKNCYINDSYICKGDLIRLELSTPETLRNSARYFNQSELSFNRLILFHLSQEHIHQYNEQFFEEINRLIP